MLAGAPLSASARPEALRRLAGRKAPTSCFGAGAASGTESGLTAGAAASPGAAGGRRGGVASRCGARGRGAGGFRRRILRGRHVDAQLFQLRLDGRLVLRAHAQQQLLAGGAGLEGRVGVFVEHLPLLQRDRAADLRRLQQVVDHLDQPVVEVLPGVAEILVGLLEQRVIADVQRAELLDVHSLNQASSAPRTGPSSRR